MLQSLAADIEEQARHDEAVLAAEQAAAAEAESAAVQDASNPQASTQQPAVTVVAIPDAGAAVSVAPLPPTSPKELPHAEAAGNDALPGAVTVTAPDKSTEGPISRPQGASAASPSPRQETDAGNQASPAGDDASTAALNVVNVTPLHAGERS